MRDDRAQPERKPRRSYSICDNDSARFGAQAASTELDRTVLLKDLMSPPSYELEEDNLLSRELYFDVPIRDYHAFEMSVL